MEQTWSRTLKEIARHLLYRAGFARRYPHLTLERVEDRFSRIYRDGLWQREAEAPSSGAGSSLAATAIVRTELPALLDQIGSRTLLDIGCGDWTWMKHVALRQDYIGIDVVPTVIETNRRQFGGERRLFLVANAIDDPLPDADVAMCREVFFHLSFSDAKALLRNVMSKPREYLIATTDRQTRFNSDIITGDGRLVNLERPPYRFPAPTAEIRDDRVASDRVLAVWHAADIMRTLG